MMTTGWSIYVIVIVAINILGCVWLIWWTGKRRPGDPAPTDTSHVWDGNLTEYNKPMPKWWVNLFYITIVFAIVYLVWYPGLGAFAGVAKWTSAGEQARDKARDDAKLEATFAPYAGKSIDVIARDPKAVALAGRSSTTPAQPATGPLHRARSAIPTSPTRSGTGAARRTTCCTRCWKAAKA